MTKIDNLMRERVAKLYQHRHFQILTATQNKNLLALANIKLLPSGSAGSVDIDRKMLTTLLNLGVADQRIKVHTHLAHSARTHSTNHTLE